MSATKALTRSRKRRAEAERPSSPGNRSLWFVTAERVREGNSSEGDDVASIPGRSRDISGTYSGCEHNSTGADQSCGSAPWSHHGGWSDSSRRRQSAGNPSVKYTRTDLGVPPTGTVPIMVVGATSARCGFVIIIQASPVRLSQISAISGHRARPKVCPCPLRLQVRRRMGTNT
jgi:hypothetical protein